MVARLIEDMHNIRFAAVEARVNRAARHISILTEEYIETLRPRLC